eukprot:6212549-Pleurochrysis_carterae.AAC.2
MTSTWPVCVGSAAAKEGTMAVMVGGASLSKKRQAHRVTLSVWVDPHAHCGGAREAAAEAIARVRRGAAHRPSVDESGGRGGPPRAQLKRACKRRARRVFHAPHRHLRAAPDVSGGRVHK